MWQLYQMLLLCSAPRSLVVLRLAGPSAPPLPPHHLPPRAARTVGGGYFKLLDRQGSGGGFGSGAYPQLVSPPAAGKCTPT